MSINELKQQARTALKGKWKYGFFSVIVIWFISNIFDAPAFVSENNLGILWTLGAIALIVGPIQTGVTWLFLDIWDGETVMYNTLFAPIRNYKKVALLTFTMYVAITLGFFAMIFPGIFLMLLFFQAPYILKENPDAGVMECLMASSNRMKGHKWPLAKLVLSFIGFILLPFIVILVSVFFLTSTAIGAILVLLSFIYVILVGFYLVPMFQTTLSGFYRQITNTQK